MENNFNQMAASVGHAVAYTIGSIFKHIMEMLVVILIKLLISGGYSIANNAVEKIIKKVQYIH